MRLLPAAPPERFEAFLETLPDVRQSWFVTGRSDDVLRIVCADTDAMDQTVRAIRQSGGVAATESRMIMRSRRPRSGTGRTS
ncbi:Lrp/AsnC ligand binding domain-containing protein [Patulibacter sp. NPDC049589]|uniref:Lrp/AsnC ligand binding domain-containing protein n=1 Tax=Patulibacter sp. NPDC049589 TaxID=3154731 RepID=UPI003412D339